MKQVADELTLFVRKHADTIPKTIAALAAMEDQLDTATYAELRHIERAAEAFKILYGNVREIKQKSESVIVEANARIGDEIAKLPRMPAGRHEIGNTRVTYSPRQAVTDNKMKASRLQRLARLGKKARKAIIDGLHKQGKDATPASVIKVIQEKERENKREEYKARTYKGGRIESLLDIVGEQKFGAIYADPAWKFEAYSGKGKQRSADRRYDTEPLEHIMDQAVGAVAAENCALFMWCVLPELPGALRVIEAWGFEFTTVAFVWIKATKKAKHVELDGDGLHWGMGYWTRANAEICILATKGAPMRLNMDVHQVIVAPVGEHSAKPEEAARRIERLVPGPYLEINARAPRKGWTTVGNELPVTAMKDAAE